MRKIACFCVIIYLALLWTGCVMQNRTRRRRIPTDRAKENIAIFKVAGLDKNAVSKLKANIQELNAVQNVRVDVKKGIVKVVLKKNKTVSVNQLKKAVKQAGYRYQQTLQRPLELEQLEKRMPKRR